MVMNKPNVIKDDKTEKDLNYYEEKYGIDVVTAMCLEWLKRTIWQLPDDKKQIIMALENREARNKKIIEGLKK